MTTPPLFIHNQNSFVYFNNTILMSYDVHRKQFSHHAIFKIFCYNLYKYGDEMIEIIPIKLKSTTIDDLFHI